MKKWMKHTIVAVCSAVTFLIPLVQLSIGFYYIVDDGKDPNVKCQAAPDLPVLLAIGGVVNLIFFGAAYGLLKMISSIGKVKSNISGNASRILTGEYVKNIFLIVRMISFQVW